METAVYLIRDTYIRLKGAFMNTSRTSLFLAGIGAVLFAPCAMALPILAGTTSDGGITWTASDADGRSAEAVFTDTDTGFTIELTSLALSTSQPNEILAGLIFGFADGSDPIILDPSADGILNVEAAAIGVAGKHRCRGDVTLG